MAPADYVLVKRRAGGSVRRTQNAVRGAPSPRPDPPGPVARWSAITRL